MGNIINDIGFQLSPIPVILFTDFTGWTAFLEQVDQMGTKSYEELAEALAGFLNFSYERSNIYGSMIANRTGDGFVSLVESDVLEERIARAFIIAEQISRYFENEFHPTLMDTFNSIKEFIPTRMRIALHSGPVCRFQHKSKWAQQDEATHDYLSHSLNVAARILGTQISRTHDMACSEVIVNHAKQSGYFSDQNGITLMPTEAKGLQSTVEIAGINFYDLNNSKIWGYE